MVPRFLVGGKASWQWRVFTQPRRTGGALPGGVGAGCCRWWVSRGRGQASKGVRGAWRLLPGGRWVHTCACVCLCVSTCVCEGEEAEGSAEPSEFCSVGDGAISQVQTLNLNHFLTLYY